jgi:hypothetical protein
MIGSAVPQEHKGWRPRNHTKSLILTLLRFNTVLKHRLAFNAMELIQQNSVLINKFYSHTMLVHIGPASPRTPNWHSSRLIILNEIFPDFPQYLQWNSWMNTPKICHNTFLSIPIFTALIFTFSTILCGDVNIHIWFHSLAIPRGHTYCKTTIRRTRAVVSCVLMISSAMCQTFGYSLLRCITKPRQIVGLQRHKITNRSCMPRPS